MYKELTERHIETFRGRLAAVPEVTRALEMAEQEPLEVSKTFLAYLRVVKRLATLTSREVQLVAEANKELNRRGGETGTAVKEGADVFLKELCENNRRKLVEIVAQAANPESAEYQEAVSDLATMIEGGHELKLAGKRPVDGDPDSDKVIWGHTQITDPISLRHFIICHYIERYVSRVLLSLDIKIARHKDFFLNALTDVIILDEIRHPGASPIFKMWSTPKDKGGLGWIKSERIDSYKAVM